MRHSTTQFDTILHDSAQYNTVRHDSAQYDTIGHDSTPVGFQNLLHLQGCFHSGSGAVPQTFDTLFGLLRLELIQLLLQVFHLPPEQVVVVRELF